MRFSQKASTLFQHLNASREVEGVLYVSLNAVA